MYVLYTWFAIFAVVLFSRVRPREHSTFNICLFIVMKTSEEKNCKIKPSWISAPSPKPWIYLYAKIMVYTVCKGYCFACMDVQWNLVIKEVGSNKTLLQQGKNFAGPRSLYFFVFYPDITRSKVIFMVPRSSV